MSYVPKYTSIQEVRYMTRLLSTDDMADAEIAQFIRDAETILEAWAVRDGVDKTTWTPIPTLIDVVATYKASEVTLAGKLQDARLATSESRSGTSMSINADPRIADFKKRAEDTWQAYLATTAHATARARPATLTPVVGYFNEDDWRKTGEEQEWGSS